MKLFSACSGECCVCVCGNGCLAGHGDDDFYPATNEQIIQRLEKGEYPRYRDEMIAELKRRGVEYADNEIVKALRNWLEEIRKSRQAYRENINEEHYPSMRYEYLLNDAICEINRLQADIKKLTSGKCVYLSDDETTEYCVEGPCPNYKTVAQIKAEAIKEFAEIVKANRRKLFNYIYSSKGFDEQIDNLLIEMESE